MRESRERLRAAMRNCGFELPNANAIINLAPADVRKEGSGFDLPMALALLGGAGEQVVEAGGEGTQTDLPELRSQVVSRCLGVSGGQVHRKSPVSAAYVEGLDLGMMAEIEGGARQTRLAAEQEGDGGGARGAAFERLGEGAAQGVRAVQIQQLEQLQRLLPGGFAEREGAVEEGLALRHG